MVTGGPRPDTWAIFTNNAGLPEDKLQALYGPKLSQTSDNPIVDEAKQAASALRTYLQSSQYEGSSKALQAAFPPIFKKWMIRERALLLQAPLGGYVPVAAVGPDGFLLLTWDMAQDSMLGRESQAPPPGGFVGGGALGTLNDVANTVTNAISHPVPRALLTALGAVATVGAFVSICRRYAKK